MRVEPARIGAFLDDPGDLLIGQVRRAIDRETDAAVVALANVLQPVARLARAGVFRVVNRRTPLVQVHFLVVDDTADEHGSHGLHLAVLGECRA